MSSSDGITSLHVSEDFEDDGDDVDDEDEDGKQQQQQQMSSSSFIEIDKEHTTSNPLHTEWVVVDC